MHRPESERMSASDELVRIGQWVFSVVGNKVYIHHATRPGDIHVTAEETGFRLEALTDDVDAVVRTSHVNYEELKETS